MKGRSRPRLWSLAFHAFLETDISSFLGESATVFHTAGNARKLATMQKLKSCDIWCIHLSSIFVIELVLVDEFFKSFAILIMAAISGSLRLGFICWGIRATYGAWSLGNMVFLLVSRHTLNVSVEEMGNKYGIVGFLPFHITTITTPIVI